MSEKYNDWLTAQQLSDNTLRVYNLYYNKLKATGKYYDQKTVNKFIKKHPNRVARSFLRSYKNFLLDNNIEVGNVRILKSKTVKRKFPDVITEEQLFDIEKGLKDEALKLMFLLSFYCALRSKELISVSVNDFNFSEWKKNGMVNNGLLVIKGKGDKYGIVPVPKILMTRIMNLVNERANPETYDVTKPLFPVSYWFWYSTVKKHVKNIINKKCSPHILRHSLAVHLVKQGYDINFIKEYLRHEDISTTQIYAKMPKEYVLKMSEKAFKQLNY